MPAPALDQDLSLAERRENFSVEQLIAQLRIEALIVAILPWAAGFDIERLHADPAEPAAHRLGGEFAAIIGSYVFRRAMDGEQFGQAMQNIVGVQLARRDDGEALARKLINDRQHAERPAVLRLVLDEIIAPDMAGALRPKTDARAVIQPEAAAFRLFLRHFEPFPPPDAIDPLEVRPPAFDAKQRGDPAIAVAAVSRRQTDDRRRQRFFIIADDGPPTLRRAWLANHGASTALRDINPGAHVPDTVPAAGRA
jgi:hypothetical protein